MIRALLVLAIRGYRRGLSGRGPLRRVRCSFHHAESCSAFGLRAAREAPAVRTAIGRIRRRLRRCRDASVFALTMADGGPALGWGADHDRELATVVGELTADGEQPAAQAVVLTARAMVSGWRGDVVEVVALGRHRRGLPATPVVLRRPPPAGRGAGGVAGRAVVAAAAIAIAARWSAPVAVGIAAVVAVVAAVAIFARRGRSARAGRLQAQARAAGRSPRRTTERGRSAAAHSQIVTHAVLHSPSTQVCVHSS